MNEGQSANAHRRARPQDVRSDYEELKLLIDRLSAITNHQNKEFERLLIHSGSMKPETALVWRVGHELLEQGIAELSAVRRRMGLRIDDVLRKMEVAESRQQTMS